MNNVKHANTHMASSIKLDQDLHGKPVNDKTYLGMIGSLLYLTTSHLDIMFSVCLYARFQSSPKDFLLIAIKRKFKYLAGTKIF